ncbi:MAG: inositol monophosphatase [Candidatus Omnitrophica bacterium]|nr:inositol monophosphatase [Candidatus Omnitrophota bacterium]
MDLNESLKLAVDAAREAGEHLQSVQSGLREVLSSKGRDIKLQADRESEKMILDRLKQSGYPVLAEESGEVGDVISTKCAWVVDPLDGTFNYSRTQPLCCVSIALVEGNRSLVGVVYDFNRDEMFSAIAPSHQAFLNGHPMEVSDVEEASKASLASGFPVNRDYSAESLQDLVGCFQRFKKIRMLGAAALSLAWVSCGRIDAYFEEDIMFWDVAAGLALVEAAGGYVDIQDSRRLKWGKVVRCGSRPSIWIDD